MTNTQQRREAIRKIIQEQPVATQNELVLLLRKTGLQATQSSISRDITHLGLIKAGGRYVLPGVGKGRVTLPVNILESQAAEALAIVKVSPGQASALGVHLDELGWPEIVGTLAGDDTLFIACRDRMSRNAVLARLTTGSVAEEEKAE